MIDHRFVWRQFDWTVRSSLKAPCFNVRCRSDTEACCTVSWK